MLRLALPARATAAAITLWSLAAPLHAQDTSVIIGGPFEGEAKTLTGAGATFPAPLYQKWFSDYAALTGVQVNYQAIG